ncbi:MAG: hypothetical protein APF83_13035 [Lutibacter sp. BRH_c52]|nr:MAG: hypothetical protein APF83_13035 [Lutibacter sp. BRH_c52]
MTIGIPENSIKFVSSNFFNIKKSSKKSLVGVLKILMIFYRKQNNKQRFKCKNCGLLFTNNRPKQRLKNRFVWFKKWVIECQTYKTLIRTVVIQKTLSNQHFI